MTTLTHKEKASDLWLSILTGLLLGACLITLVRYALPYMPARLTASSFDYSAPRLLVEAHNENITYRASAIGIEPGSKLEQAIMAEQPGNIRLLESLSPGADKTPIVFSSRYIRTAKAGPLTSLLRVENVIWEDGRSDTRYAASLINELRPDDFRLSDIFKEDATARLDLDALLCRAMHQAKRMRVGNNDDFFCSAVQQFLKSDPVIFVNSAHPNSIGGLRYYFDAGELGAISEGDYIITIPQSAFRQHLRPAYRGLFAGAPPELE